MGTCNCTLCVTLSVEEAMIPVMACGAAVWQPIEVWG